MEGTGSRSGHQPSNIDRPETDRRWMSVGWCDEPLVSRPEREERGLALLKISRVPFLCRDM